MRSAVPLLLVLSALLACKSDVKNTAAPPGNVSAYDPFAHVPQVLTFAGPDGKLLAIKAVGVASSGTLNLPASPEHHVEYRAAAKDDDGRYVNVHVDVHAPRDVQQTTTKNSSTGKKDLGMARRADPYNSLVGSPASDAIAAPKCTAADLWTKAAAAGAPTTELATIEYDAKGYELRVLKPKFFSLKFDADCTPLPN